MNKQYAVLKPIYFDLEEESNFLFFFYLMSNIHLNLRIFYDIVKLSFKTEHRK